MDLYRYLFGNSREEDIFDELAKDFSKNANTYTISNPGPDAKYYYKGNKITEDEYNTKSASTAVKNIDKNYINSDEFKTDFVEYKDIFDDFTPDEDEEGVLLHDLFPKTWNAPNNKNYSCYINSALWGLLYNNSFLPIIKRVNTNILTDNPKKCDEKIFNNLKFELENYKNGILNKPPDINLAVVNIRKILQDCYPIKNMNWTTNMGDPSEFLIAINNLFTNQSPLAVTNLINQGTVNIDNYVVFTQNVVTTLDPNSNLKDTAIYEDLFNDATPVPNISYNILPIISITTNETTGDMNTIINTHQGNKEIITVIDKDNFKRTITKGVVYSGDNDGTEETTEVRTGVTTKYININSIKTTTQTYDLNNNYEGIIINYKQNQGSTMALENDLPQVWKNLNNKIQDKYFKIGRYILSAFSCWVSSSHYTCYFEFKNDWYLMNDHPSGKISKVDFNNKTHRDLFKKNLFRNSFVFFYKFDNSLDDSNRNCSQVFAYDIKVNQAQIDISAASISQPRQSSAKRTPLYAQKTFSSTSSSLSASKEEDDLPQVFNSQIQMINNCEKNGKNWLELFVQEGTPPVKVGVSSTPPGQPVINQTPQPTSPSSSPSSSSTPLGQPVINQTPSQSSSVSSPVSSSSQSSQNLNIGKYYINNDNTPIQIKSTSKSKNYAGRILYDSEQAARDVITATNLAADKALLDLKNDISKIKNVEAQNIIDKTDAVNIIAEHNMIKDYNPGTVIYFKGKVYVVLKDGKYYNVTDDIIGSKPTLGGTRKRNRNIKGGKRTRKGIKCKKTRKLIRNKNKLLKSNKLRRTKKRNLNKRTRK